MMMYSGVQVVVPALGSYCRSSSVSNIRACLSHEGSPFLKRTIHFSDEYSPSDFTYCCVLIVGDSTGVLKQDVLIEVDSTGVRNVKNSEDDRGEIRDKKAAPSLVTKTQHLSLYHHHIIIDR